MSSSELGLGLVEEADHAGGERVVAAVRAHEALDAALKPRDTLGVALEVHVQLAQPVRLGACHETRTRPSASGGP